MKRLAIVALVAACSDDGGAPTNAAVLWLALDGRETDVRLVEQEPDPY